MLRSVMLTRYRMGFSRCKLFALCLLHIAALIVLWQTDMRISIGLVLFVAILASLVVHAISASGNSRSASRHDFSLRQNKVTFFDDATPVWHGTVLAQTVVMPYFILLCVKPDQPGRTLRLLICADALPEQEFRRLRTQLRLSQ